VQNRITRVTLTYCTPTQTNKLIVI